MVTERETRERIFVTTLSCSKAFVKRPLQRVVHPLSERTHPKSDRSVSAFTSHARHRMSGQHVHSALPDQSLLLLHKGPRTLHFAGASVWLRVRCLPTQAQFSQAADASLGTGPSVLGWSHTHSRETATRALVREGLPR